MIVSVRLSKPFQGMKKAWSCREFQEQEKNIEKALKPEKYG